jgi:hypothetical protein
MHDMDIEYRAECHSNREWKKLAILKRATILSYLHTMLTEEMFSMIKHDSKYDLIETIDNLGMADDCIQSFAVRY